MSDDEYFNNDDIFTAEELDNIPLLNQPPSPTIPALDISNAAIVVSHSQAVTSNVPGSSVNNPIVIAEAPSNSPRSPLRTGNREQDQALTTGPASAPAQASGSQRSAPVAVRRESSRLSTIMNALRASQPGQISGLFHTIRHIESILICQPQTSASALLVKFSALQLGYCKLQSKATATPTRENLFLRLGWLGLPARVPRNEL
jgi:hypothetical protein